MTRRSASCVGVVLFVLADADADQAIKVGPNVHVSAHRPRQEHWELQIATDPTDRRRLIACSMMLDAQQNELRTINYLSSDAGRTWKARLEVDGGLQSADPVCGFGADGTVYAISLVNPLENNKRARYVDIDRSTDHGEHWGTPQRLRFIDREYLTVDLSGGPRHGRLYLHGTDLLRSLEGELASGFAVFGAANGTADFLEVQAKTSGSEFIGPMGNGVVLSNGRFAAVFGQRRTLSVVLSDDGGSTLERIAVTRRWARCRSIGGAAPLMPYLAADRSDGPFNDRLYLVYPEASQGQCNIAFTYSTDRGRTWSSPTIINDDQPRANDHWLPTIAVNKFGVVGVTWLDRREEPTGHGTHLRFAASFDGGDTFRPSVRVSEEPNVAHWKNPMSLRLWEFGGAGPWTQRADAVQLRIGAGGEADLWSGGDTSGLATGGSGEFHTIWTYNRSGVTQVWTSRIDVAGSAALNDRSRAAR